MPHSAVPCSSHQSALATSLRGRTVGLPLVLYLHGHGLQDMEQEAPVAACLWQCEGGVGSQPPRGMANWELGSTEEKMLRRYSQGLGQRVCCLWLLTWLFLFCSSKRDKMQGNASAQGHRDWQGASLRKQTAMCALLTLSSSLAAISPVLRPGFTSLFPKYWVHYNKNCQKECLTYLFICKFFSRLCTANIANIQIYNPYWRWILSFIFFFWENQHGLVPQWRNRMSGMFKALWHPPKEKPKATTTNKAN